MNLDDTKYGFCISRSLKANASSTEATLFEYMNIWKETDIKVPQVAESEVWVRQSLSDQHADQMEIFNHGLQAALGSIVWPLAKTMLSKCGGK